jgi:hypothetical protein
LLWGDTGSIGGVGVVDGLSSDISLFFSSFSSFDRSFLAGTVPVDGFAFGGIFASIEGARYFEDPKYAEGFIYVEGVGCTRDVVKEGLLSYGSMEVRTAAP